MNEIITKLLASTAALALAAFSPSAFAQSPQGATVASGSITVTRQGATTVVTQGTDKGIIDWRSFSIGAQEAVRFDQPGRSSVTLNRVTGSELSRIDGHLSATGQVWLSNPNGVLIGPGGQVNVGGLLATTGRIDAAEFLRSGRAAIDQIGKDAAIVNSGAINITEGGYAALAAASIRNEGVIAARAGSVALGAGKAVTLDFTGDKLITFQVTKPLDQAVPGDSMISAGGVIAAEGGTVLMSARAAKGVMDNVINLKGHVVANSVTVDGGTVSFGDGGIVQVSGKIDASDPAGKGGAVAVLGEKVGLMDRASIDASGATGGGTVLVGGDWQGKGTVQNAQIAYAAPTATINVDATMAGDGGKAVVWADDTARFNGTISARGGVLAGDGGQVETSGKRSLSVGPTSVVTTANRAPSTKAGSWLLDPNDIVVKANSGVDANAVNTAGNYSASADAASTIDVGNLSSALSVTNVTIMTTNSYTTGSGDITFSSGSTLSYTGGSSTLVLRADRDIVFQSGSAILSTTNPLNVTLVARSAGGATFGAIGIDGNISTKGGDIHLGGPLVSSAFGGGGGTLNTGVSINAGRVLDAQGGNITIRGRGAADHAGVVIQGAVKTSGSGTISITGETPSASTNAAYGVQIASTGSVETSGTGAITITGSSQNSAAGSHGVYVQGAITNTGSSTGLITLTGTRGGGSGSHNIVISGGSVTSALGDITLDGNATTSFGAIGGYGVRVNAGTVSTAGGSIIISGTGDQGASGSSHIGVLIDGSSPLISVTTGTGSITLTGKRGGGSGSQNIFISGGSAIQLATLSTASGSITVDGSASTAGATTTLTSMDGVFIENALIKSGGGISINGNADTVAKNASNGVSIFESTTLSLTGGNLSILGNAQNAAGNDIFFQNSTVSGGTGTVTLVGDAINGSGVGWTAGKTVLLPRTSTNIDVLANPSVGTLGLGGALGFITGPTVIGATSINSQITYSGTTLDRDLTLISGTGNINFTGASLDSSGGARALTVQTDGVVSFAGLIGATPLASLNRISVSGGNTGITQFGSGATQLKTSGNQSFSGPVELTAASVLFDSSAGGVTFNGPVDSAVSLSHSNLVVNAATSGVVFNNNFGLKTGYALASFSSGSGTTATFKGSNYVTDGSQAYGGAILLGNDATIAAGGAVTFGSTIDTAASTAAKALTVNAASVAFNTLAGAIGGGTALSSLSLSVTNNDIVLPALTVLNDLTVSTSGAGTITQVGGMSVGNLAMFTASTGDVTLFNALNNFNKFSVTTTSGAVAVWDSAGSIDITGANIGSGGSLIIGNSAAAPGTIIQSGAITTPSLSFSNADKIILNNAANKVGALIGNFNNTATNQSLLFSNGSAGGLTLGNLIGKSLDITQSGGGAVTVAGLVSGTDQVDIHQTGGGALNVNGTIATTGKADVYASGGALSFGVGSLLSAGTASFGGASVNGSSTTISVTNAPLVLYASSGSITGSTISVNANATNPVASGFVTLATTGGAITLNSETLNGPPAPVVVVTPTTATAATVASLATVASVATIATVASVASSATAPTIPTGASVASIPTISFVQNVINIITNAEPGGVTTIINQVLPPTPNFSLVLSTPPAGGDSGQRSGAVNSSAQALANLVTSTPAGAFIPPSAPFVAGTGAPLAVTPTIKVDAADTGGPNGQVIALGQSGGAGGGGRAVLPGLLSEFRNPAAAPGNQEPPPGQLPATMNEEPLLD